MTQGIERAFCLTLNPSAISAMLLCIKNIFIKITWMLIIGTTPVSTMKPNQTDKSTLGAPQTDIRVTVPLTPLTPLFQEDLTWNIADSEMQQESSIRQKRSNNSSLAISPAHPLTIKQRLRIDQDSRMAMRELVKFFMESSTGRNVFFFYDQILFPYISEAASSCFKIMAEVTLLRCDEALDKIEKIIRTFNVLESLRNIIVLCSSKLTLQLFEQIRNRYLESISTHWFVVLQTNITQDLLYVIREGTQVSFVVREYDFKYELYVSFVAVNNNISLHRIGWWSWDAERGPSKSLKAPFFRPLEDVYSDLASRHLTATIYPNWPRWIMEELDDGTTRPISGVDYHVLTDVSQKLNFTFWVKVMPTSFGMGGVRPNGNVVGLIGEVHRHAVHLVINEVTLTANREIAVDFTYPYFSEAVTLISPAPRKKLKEYAVFTPFTYEVWILLIIVTMLMGPIVKLIMWIRKIYLKESCEMWESLSDTSFNVFKSVVMQHADNPPGGAIYMVMFGSWYIFCLLMTSLYADVMISALVAPSYEKPIDSLYDLLDAIEHRDYKILLYCGTQSEYMFTNTDKKIYKDIGNTFDYSLKCIKNQDEGMDKIVTGKFVGVNNHMSAEVRANLRGRERYHIARNQFYAHGYGIACPTGSPYKEAFNKVLLPLMWSGIIQKYTNDELRKARTSTHFEEEGPEAFSLLHLQGGFFLFLVGNIGATVAFLAELGAGYYLKNVPDLS